MKSLGSCHTLLKFYLSTRRSRIGEAQNRIRYYAKYDQARTPQAVREINKNCVKVEAYSKAFELFTFTEFMFLLCSNVVIVQKLVQAASFDEHHCTR